MMTTVAYFQGMDVKKSLRDFQQRMYSAQFMTLAVISKGVFAKLILSIVWLVEKGLFSKMT